MAYGSYFPTGYQPFQYQQIQQPMQTQNSYLPVRSEEEARNYPVAPGNIMTFFDETKPYCYKKAMGASPLDRPVFEKYRIVKEEILEPAPQSGSVQGAEDKNAEMGKIRAEMDTLKRRIKRLEEKYEQPVIDLSADDEQSHAVLYTDGDSGRHSKRPESDHPVYAEHRQGNTRPSKQRYADEEQSDYSEYV